MLEEKYNNKYADINDNSFIIKDRPFFVYTTHKRLQTC